MNRFRKMSPSEPEGEPLAAGVPTISLLGSEAATLLRLDVSDNSASDSVCWRTDREELGLYARIQNQKIYLHPFYY